MDSSGSSSRHRDILRLITAIRTSHKDIERLYLEGQCYNFFKILCAVYPCAECWYDPAEGHVYTKIGRYFYDIRGVQFASGLVPLDHLNGDRPHRWGSRDKRCFILKDWEDA